MKRGKHLRRRKAIRSRRATPRRANRTRDIDYVLGVKQLTCAAVAVPGHVCAGPIEADHAGVRPMGQKAHDSTVIPLCQLAHRQRTDFSGPFRKWDQAQMRAFLTTSIELTRAAMRRRGFDVPEYEITTVAPEPVVGVVTVYAAGRSASAEVAGMYDPATGEIVASAALLADTVNRLTEDLREDGNLDVRYPDAAPLPVARVVSEGVKNR